MLCCNRNRERGRVMYKILICDDERDIRNALRIYLTGEGYAVCEAASGTEALELLRREAVQLVLMDILRIPYQIPLIFQVHLLSFLLLHQLSYL